MKKTQHPSKSILEGKKGHQDYNNVIQENLRETLQPLLFKIFGLENLRTGELDTQKIHRTIARDPDVLKAILDEEGNHIETLHGEFNLKDEEEVTYRVAEYNVMYLREFRKTVRSFVLYLGRGSAKNIKPELKAGELHFKFVLKNIEDFSSKEFLASGKWEEVIFALLANYEGAEPGTVLYYVVEKVKSFQLESLELEKCQKQLEIFSAMRNLPFETTKKILDTMPIIYDIEKDIRYQQGVELGVELGVEKGIQKGIQKGINEHARTTVQNMLADSSLTHEQVANFASVSLEFVQNIAQEMKQKAQATKAKKTVQSSIPSEAIKKAATVAKKKATEAKPKRTTNPAGRKPKKP